MEDFPVQYYEVISGKTITKRGVWWTAALILRDPERDNIFLAIYRWRKKGDSWTRNKQITFSNIDKWDEIDSYIREAIKDAKEKLSNEEIQE